MNVIIFLFISLSAFADCIPRSTQELVSRSNYIVSATIFAANFKNACEGTSVRELKYKAKVSAVLLGKLPLGEYDLSYTQNCNQKPSAHHFREGDEVILAIKSIDKNALELSGLHCDWWGWDMVELKLVKIAIKNSKR